MIGGHVGQAARNSTGKMRSSRMASCSAAIRCSSGMVPFSKYSSISSSLPSATSSTSASCARLGVGRQGRGNLADLAAAIAAGRVEERLHGHQVDHAVKSLRIDDGQLDRDAVAAPALVQVVNQCAQTASAAGLGVVHLVDDHDARHDWLLRHISRRARSRPRRRSGR